jgi:hypothetical protein
MSDSEQLKILKLEFSLLSIVLCQRSLKILFSFGHLGFSQNPHSKHRRHYLMPSGSVEYRSDSPSVAFAKLCGTYDKFSKIQLVFHLRLILLMPKGFSHFY